MSNTQTPWYGSTGFWNGLVLALSGLVVGFPAGDSSNAIAALFALFASGNAIRDGLSGKHLDVKAWALSKNTWNYLAATIVAIVPMFPAEIVQSAGDAVAAAIGGNWQGIFVAVFSIGTTLYYWLKPSGKP